MPQIPPPLFCKSPISSQEESFDNIIIIVILKNALPVEQHSCLLPFVHLHRALDRCGTLLSAEMKPVVPFPPAPLPAAYQTSRQNSLLLLLLLPLSLPLPGAEAMAWRSPISFLLALQSSGHLSVAWQREGPPQRTWPCLLIRVPKKFMYVC